MAIEDAADLAEYMKEYIKQYREEYKRIINNGYPALDISPYLNSKEIVCYLANNGIVIVVLAVKPQNTRIALDYNLDPSIKDDITIEYIDGIIKGSFPDALSVAFEKIENTKISVKQYDLDLLDIVMGLTLGVIGLSLDIHLYSQPRQSIIMRNIDFVLANKKHAYSYLEIIPNISIIAYEAIWQKVFFDVRRDYIHKLTMEDYIAKEKEDKSGATMEFYDTKKILDYVDKFYEFRGFLKLSKVRCVLNEFKSLLDEHNDERTFQEFLENNTILLELFTKMLGAKIESQPLFPDINRETGSESRRPDFLICYSKNYVLIELEKPTKRLCTQNGEQSSELTQVVTQIADWIHIIRNSVDLQLKYDGIRDNCDYIIIAGRKSDDASFNIFMNRFKDTHKDITLYTYDDFIEILERYIERLEKLI